MRRTQSIGCGAAKREARGRPGAFDRQRIAVKRPAATHANPGINRVFAIFTHKRYYITTCFSSPPFHFGIFDSVATGIVPAAPYPFAHDKGGTRARVPPLVVSGIHFVMVIVRVAFLPSWVVVVIFAVPAFTAVSVRYFSDMQTPAP